MNTVERPVVDFDHNSREHAEDPMRSFEALRERCPLTYSERCGGFWIATGWDEVALIGRDPHRFSTAPRDGMSASAIPTRPEPFPRPPLHVDPPDFVGYRRLLDPFFAPKAVAELEPGIQHWADFFLDRVIETGEMELVGDYATPVPSTVTVDWLGLSPADWQFYASRFHLNQHTTPDSPDYEQARQGMAEIVARLGPELAKRRGHPRDDVLSALATGTIDGRPLSEENALGTAAFVISGGVATTAILTTHSALLLAERPETHDALLADDHFMRTATEELLRYATPVLSTSRRLEDDVDWAGLRAGRGERVLVAWAGANRDATVFPNPDELDLERWPNRHVAFGIGPHRCIGSNMARAMFKIMIRTLLRRIPDLRVVEAVPMHNRAIDNAFASVRVEFTPGPRVLPTDSARPQFAP